MIANILRLPTNVLEDFARELNKHEEEDACFFLFRRLKTADRQIIMVRRVVPIAEEHVVRRTRNEILFEGAALVRAFRHAIEDHSFLGFAHSHPDGAFSFSDKDDAVDKSILNTIQNRMEHQPVYPSLIWANGSFCNGRVWTPRAVHRCITSVSVVGESLSFFPLPPRNEATIDEAFSRQVELFSSKLQTEISKLRVGVVGLGGTGSAVIMQVARLGVGELLLVDPDRVERSNVNRLHGAALKDVSSKKSDVAEALVRSIGMGTRIRSFFANVADQDVAKIVGTCDVVFACTDDELGRSILSRISYACLVPVFDMGIKIDIKGGILNNIDGRVTTLLPSEACLECRGRITPEGIRADSLRNYDPEQAEVLERDGYLGRADLNAPAVVTFTTGIAVHAINELFHRTMGLFGPTRKSSEILVRFKVLEIRGNRKAKRDGCYCHNKSFRGSGDASPFLGIMWQS